MDKFLQWLSGSRDKVLDDLASGNVEIITRRYLPAVFACGLFVGCLLSLLSLFVGIMITLLAGVGIGYGARSFISYRRRERARSERAQSFFR